MQGLLNYYRSIPGGEGLNGVFTALGSMAEPEEEAISSSDEESGEPVFFTRLNEVLTSYNALLAKHSLSPKKAAAAYAVVYEVKELIEARYSKIVASAAWKEAVEKIGKTLVEYKGTELFLGRGVASWACFYVYSSRDPEDIDWKIRRYQTVFEQMQVEGPAGSLEECQETFRTAVKTIRLEPNADRVYRLFTAINLKKISRAAIEKLAFWGLGYQRHANKDDIIERLQETFRGLKNAAQKRKCTISLAEQVADSAVSIRPNDCFTEDGFDPILRDNIPQKFFLFALPGNKSVQVTAFGTPTIEKYSSGVEITPEFLSYIEALKIKGVIKAAEQDGPYHNCHVQPQASQEAPALQSHIRRSNHQSLPGTVGQGEQVITEEK